MQQFSVLQAQLLIASPQTILTFLASIFNAFPQVVGTDFGVVHITVIILNVSLPKLFGFITAFGVDIVSGVAETSGSFRGNLFLNLFV